MAGREVTYVVECYGTNVTSYGDTALEIDTPAYKVRGKTFLRTIYRPIGKIDVLLSQCREADDMYQFSAFLPDNAMQSRDDLRQCVADFPPTANVRVIPDHFNDLGWTWQNAATVISEYVDKSYFDGETPFFVESDEAFGTVTLLREANRWRNEFWRQDPPQEIVVHDCVFCLENIDDAPIEDLLGLHCCQHVFHRACILNGVWKKHDPPSCPTCSSLI